LRLLGVEATAMPSQNPDPCIPSRLASDDPPGGPEGAHRAGRSCDGDPAELCQPIEASFRHFAESLSDLVWAARPDGHIDYYNRRLLDYLGTTFEVMRGRDTAETLHPDDIGRSRRAWEDASAAGVEYEIEYRIRRHDGQYRWHRSHATPMRDADGRIVRWFGTCVDVDDARRAEEAIRASEERFRHLADAIPQMVWVTRPDRSVEYVNRRWLDYTGQTPEEALGPEGWAAAGSTHLQSRLQPALSPGSHHPNHSGAAWS
jgi:PAS domain S-box-containing protein